MKFDVSKVQAGDWKKVAELLFNLGVASVCVEPLRFAYELSEDEARKAAFQAARDESDGFSSQLKALGVTFG